MEEKDVCTKGKSCKLACIKTNLICREELKESVQKGLTRLLNLLPAPLRSILPPPRQQDSKATSVMKKGEDFLKEYNPKIKHFSERIDTINKELKSLESRLDRGGKMSSETERELKARFSRNLTELEKAYSEMRGVMTAIRSKMLSSTKVNKSQIDGILSNLDIHNAGEKKGEIRQQLVEFIKMFNGKGFKNEKDTPRNISQLTTVFVDRGRAWAHATLGHLSTDGNKGNTFHEVAHFVEHQRPWLKQYMEEWRNSRAWSKAEIEDSVGSTGKPLPIVSSLSFKGKSIPTMPINYIYRSNFYAKDEIAVVDMFMSPYMGRVYKSGGTEVLSVAMEQFASPRRMVTLHRTHPDLFNLVVGLSVD